MIDTDAIRIKWGIIDCKGWNRALAEPQAAQAFRGLS